jgi:hypothetical protein
MDRSDADDARLAPERSRNAEESDAAGDPYQEGAPRDTHDGVRPGSDPVAAVSMPRSMRAQYLPLSTLFVFLKVS